MGSYSFCTLLNFDTINTQVTTHHLYNGSPTSTRWRLWCEDLQDHRPPRQQQGVPGLRQGAPSAVPADPAPLCRPTLGVAEELQLRKPPRDTDPHWRTVP